MIWDQLNRNASAYLGLIYGLQQQYNTTNINTTLLASVVRGAVCTGNRSEYLLSLPSPDLTLDLVDQLCNLTLEQFTSLVQDLQEDVNTTKLMADVSGGILYLKNSA